MKLKEQFNYDNPLYAPLKEPAKGVIKAYQDANRWFDTIQEYVYIEQGLKNCAQVCHRQAHRFPQYFDRFADMLHERHLMAIYGATEELDIYAEAKNMDDIFALIIRIFEHIQEALEIFHRATDNAQFRPMALYVEELMLTNSKDHTKFLELWCIYDQLNDKGNASSPTSFDNYCKAYLEEDDK